MKVHPSLDTNESLHQTIWRFIDSDTKHSYDDILAMDKQIRQLIGRLPKVDSEGNVLGSATKRKNALAQSVSLTTPLLVVTSGQKLM